MDLRLSSYWRSSCSWRVRIALHWKGLAFEILPVHLVEGGGQQHSEAHRRRNPMRELPVLEVGEDALAQSMAILEYLEERFEDPALLPQGALERARVRQMAEVVNSGIQPVQNLRVMQRLGKDFGLSKEEQVA
ncbi:MAG: glutathione S-transferase N-terminal domain-containing protein, partial [Myxococcota bacterium]|nr:glutathione S-transferase N-terminal domain-containing protein [Myxococcota bacterium]